MVTRYDPCDDWVGVEMVEFGDYVSHEDFQACVEAFDALIVVAEATRKLLADTPEPYPSDRHAERGSVVLDDAINDAVMLLDDGIAKAKEFE